MKNIKQMMNSMLKRISNATRTPRDFVSGVAFLFGVVFLILVALATYDLLTVPQVGGGEPTKKSQSLSDEKTVLKRSQPSKKQVSTSETEGSKTIEMSETSNSKTEGHSQSEPTSTIIDNDTTVENVVTTSAPIMSVSAKVVNRHGTTGSPLYHDGLPSANELTSLTLNRQEGNVTTYDYYFKDTLSIPSYGRHAEGIQSGQLIVTVNNNDTATISITGGVPQVTNMGSDAVQIQNYTVGETRTIGVAAGQQIQGLLVQQSFGQSPLGSVDNLSGDYLLTFNK